MIISELFLGDCLNILKKLEDGAIDFVLADLPYGTTKCKWDIRIPFEPLWKELHRVCKPNAAMAMFGTEPFSTLMRMSNLSRFRYDWIWQKDRAPNFLFMNKMPGKLTELCSVFYSFQPVYNPQKIDNPLGFSKRHLRKYTVSLTEREHMGPSWKITRGPGKNYEPGKLLPNNILKFSRECGLHPTQKPVPLLEYLIKTYTNEGDTVLDPTMGSGSTGVACKNLGRKFIGIEMDEGYFEIAKRRIEACESPTTEVNK